MKKSLLLIFFLHFLAFGFGQSIIVNGAGSVESSYEANELVTNVLLDGGSCSFTSNFQLKDNPSEPFPSLNRSWGYFTKGNSNFPFDRGIVLTSGYAIDAEGPDSGIVSEGNTNWTGDSDATQLAQTNTFNATIFEFDFVPQGDQISFNYIFASEEYPSFACNSTYNDVFGFIISGPGITPDPGLTGKNIALLPDGQPVTINNVNDQGCGNPNFYVAGPFNDIEYGGRTVPLTASSTVIPGETYHIRLLVADAGDRAFDSAVFLEAGSFSLGSTIVDINGNDVGDTLMVCDNDEVELFVNTDDPEATIQWFFNDNPIPGATGISITATESGVYMVEVTSGDCTATDSVEIFFGELPTNGDSFILEAVDTDGDGIATFNLTQVIPWAVDDPDDYAFSFYETEDDANTQDNPIANPLAYDATDGTIVYMRIDNLQGCVKVVQILLRVLDDCINPEAACPGPEFGLNIPFLSDGEIPPSAPPGPNYGCLGSQPYPRFYYFRVDQPGDLIFHMSQYTEPDEQGTPIDVDFIVWGPFDEVPCDYEDLQTIVDCSYSPSPFETVTIPNAQSGEIYLMMITNYAGTYDMFGYVNLVFDEELSTGSFDCSIITGDVEYSECDDDGDGQVSFDLSAIAEDIRDGDETLSIAFYSTFEDAENDTGNNTIPTGPYTVTLANSPVEIYAQVKDFTGEVTEVIKVKLSILEGVEGAVDAYAFYCDSGDDGVEIIDLTEIEVIDSPELYTIRYYEDESDAIAGNSAFIPNPGQYETGSTTIYVRIENENGCFDVVEITIEIAGLEVSLGEDFSMCEGEFPLTAQGDFDGYTGLTFTWYFNGQVISGEEEQTLYINQPGTYTVVVETEEGCSGSASVVVSPGEEATITEVHVGPDYVIVHAVGGVEPYQYSMTGVVWQDHNQFNYLPPGIHTVYVKTAEGCVSSAQFAIFNIPTLFTPNGDGINDTWNIPGLEIYPDSEVMIYDRYGRLVYEARLNSSTIWDGYFMDGKKAPTQDYWYIIKVTDGRRLTGHVTVKSRGEKY